jgi:predicted  nucleic acid-binding Zn-ribbon protein
MNRGEPLHRLQTLDLELETVQRRITAIQAGLGESEALLLARQAAVAAENEHRKWMTQTRDLELEIEGLNSKIGSGDLDVSGRRAAPCGLRVSLAPAT